jgi:C4-dicarboxylate transporter DctQ subunit
MGAWLLPQLVAKGDVPVKKVMKSLEKAEQWFIGILLLVTVLLLFVNVIMRYVFSSNLTWAEEFSRYAIVWISFVGSSVCIYKGGHITVDSILGLLSEKKGQNFSIGILIASLLFSVLLGYYSVLLTLNSIRTGQTTPGMQIPMFWAYLAMPVGSALLSLHYGWQIHETFQLARRKSS